MFAVNSEGKTVETTKSKVINLLRPEIKLGEMKFFTNVLKMNFPENVDFTYAHQPLYSKEMVIFYCKTEVSGASRIVNESLDIVNHLDEPLEKVDMMRSLFSVKQFNKVCWYYLTVGAYVIERNFYDGKPIGISYIQPVSYASFLRNFKESQITSEELAKGGLCKKYIVIEGLDLDKPESLIPYSFDRDMTQGKSEKDNKMYLFSKAWNDKKINESGKDSNTASSYLWIADKKRNDCYKNYCDIKNLIVKNYKGSYGIKYKQNIVTAILNDGRKITIYIYGTNESPKFLINGYIASDLEGLRKIISENKNESEWFTKNVKPFL